MGDRSATDANEGRVAAALRGDDPFVRLRSSPGTLAVFCGRHALHRVSQISGARPRINAVLTYGEEPDMTLNELTQRIFYGRVA